MIHELSPYLLQHAYNPVDWYPWNEEAFAKAKADVILISGYDGGTGAAPASSVKHEIKSHLSIALQ